MQRKLIILLVLVLMPIVFLGVGRTAAKEKKVISPNYFATLKIHDGYGQVLFSDGKREGLYEDWRLASEGFDPCVKAWVKKDGFFFIYTNRGSNLGSECEENFPSELRRWYVLDLGIEGIGIVEGDRIRAEKLFSKGAQETTISFMFDHDGVSYTLNTSGDISGSGDTRLVYNNYRNAQLWRFPPKGSRPGKLVLIDEFPFPFMLTVTRVAQ